MIAAIETLRSASPGSVRVPGRLRLIGVLASLAAVILLVRSGCRGRRGIMRCAWCLRSSAPRSVRR